MLSYIEELHSKAKQGNDIGSVNLVLHFRNLLYDHAQKWPGSAGTFIELFRMHSSKVEGRA